MTRKKKKKIICMAAAFLCLVLAAGYTVVIQPFLNREKWVYKTAEAEKGTLTVGVTESGSLEYGITSRMYDLNLTVSSDGSDSENEDSEDESSEDDEEVTEKYLKVEEVYVAAGQRISEGDALLKFTDKSVSDVRKLLTAAQTEAEITYSEAQSEYNLSLLSAELSYQSDITASQYAGTIYQYENQAAEDNISLLRAELSVLQGKTEALNDAYDEALESYNEALEEYETASEILQQVGDNLYVTYQASYLRAESNYEAAKSRLEQAAKSIEDNIDEIAAAEKEIVLEEKRLAINKLEAKQAYEEDTLTGSVAETEYAAELMELQETLSEAQEELTVAQEQLQAFETFVGTEGIVYAQGSGIVTQVYCEAEDKLTSAGMLVSYAQAEDMTITVNVTQEDITGMAVGDEVKIEFAAYEDTVYEGIITAIETAKTAEGATVSYPVTILVQGDTSALYGGMTANVTFVTEEKEDVLYISRKALVEENGKTYVYVDNAFGKKVLTEVKTGLQNGMYVEITEGLSEGDTYYIASRVTDISEEGTGGNP